MSDGVAVWGAITGSIGTLTGVVALSWGIYKWKREGPRFKISVRKEMSDYGIVGSTKFPVLVLEAIYRGQPGTEVYEMVGFSRPPWKRRRPVTKWDLEPTNTLPPKRLLTNEKWVGKIHLTAVVLDAAKAGNLYLGVRHSASDRPALKHVTGEDLGLGT